MKNKPNIKSYALSASLLLAVTASYADTFVYGPTTGDWSNASGWINLNDGNSTGALPTATDLVILNQVRTVDVTSAIAFGGDLQIQNTNTPGDSATLDVRSGSLAASTVVVQAGTAEGVLNVSGGALTVNGQLTNNNVITLSAGSIINGQDSLGAGGAPNGQNSLFTTGANGVFNITGGTYNGGGDDFFDTGSFGGTALNISGTGALSTLRQVTNGSAAWTITGSNASINVGALNLSSGVVNFVADAGGFSAIASSAFTSIDGLDVNVNVTALTTPGVYDLFTSGNIASLSSDVTLSGQVEGFEYIYEQALAGNGNYSRIVVTAIPEPGTCALFGGLLSLSWVMIRRRK